MSLGYLVLIFLVCRTAPTQARTAPYQNFHFFLKWLTIVLFCVVILLYQKACHSKRQQSLRHTRSGDIFYLTNGPFEMAHFKWGNFFKFRKKIAIDKEQNTRKSTRKNTRKNTRKSTIGKDSKI